MSYKQDLVQQFPNTFFASIEDLNGLTEYLANTSFLGKDEVLKNITIPGAGNMNVVFRIETNQRSFVLKQSRPWVEKYPNIKAPIERIQTEAEFYTTIQSSVLLKSHSPEIFLVDIENFIVIMEDLGKVEDFTRIYSSGYELSTKDITNLSTYLIELHQLKPADYPSNQEMRILNHAHIFDIPFQSNNGIDLNAVQNGLANLATSITSDTHLRSIVQSLGDHYLSVGSNLLHGDYYPGSWMESDQFYVLDPEFSFLGPAEFDLGVCLAHLTIADQKPEYIQLFLESYKAVLPVDEGQVKSFAGIEILRRLLGVAQLPLSYSLDQKKELIELSCRWITSNI